ncbi:MAG TPA: hypothetical protein VFG30_32795 [Polyangiales bacterium]|nr:hypothetical protein [Polyangiales bacterium]
MRERPDSRSQTRIPWLRLVALGGVTALLVAIAPLLWTAIRAGVSLFALAALMLVGWASLQALPYWGERLERRLLRARIVDARDNPIEALLGQLLQHRAQLERYRAALAAIGGQIQGMRDMLEERRAVAPQHDTHKQTAALHKMVAFHAHHLKNLAAAELALADYQRHLNTKRFEWSFAQAGKRVLDSLRARDRESIIRELLTDEATRSVQSSFNQVFASLDAELQRVEQLGPENSARLSQLAGELS